jgi:MFS family permease
MYSFANIAYVIGPLIAGYTAEKMGISLIFVLSAIFIFIALFLFKLSNIRHKNIKEKIDANFIKNFLDFFKSKERSLAYVVRGGVNLWWILIYLFIPLYIIRNGLYDRWVGYFLFAIAIPLILFEYKFSKIAGKYGFKKMFKIGFLIPAVIAFICFFISNIYIIMGLLALASVGLAMVEPTTEAYFFDILKSREDECRFYPSYSTTMDVNNFFGKIIASTLLIFLPFKAVFLMFSCFMFIMFLLSFRVKKIVEEKRKIHSRRR